MQILLIQDLYDSKNHTHHLKGINNLWASFISSICKVSTFSQVKIFITGIIKSIAYQFDDHSPSRIEKDLCLD
jgi:hypothetical protein